jgi:hypothetical protein
LLVCRGEVHIYFFVAQQPNSVQTTSLLLRFLDHTQFNTHTHSLTHTYTHTRQHSSEQVINLSQRPLNTQQEQKTKIHAHSGIRTHDINNQAVADFRFRPHGKPESARTVSVEIICLSVLRSLDITSYSYFCTANVLVKFDLRTLLYIKRNL